MLGPGTVLGKYVVLSPIQDGIEAVVYRARDLIAQREVALKLFRRPFPMVDETEEPIATLLGAQVHHAQVIPIHDVVVDGERLILVIPIPDGLTLGTQMERMRPGPWPLPEVFAVMKPVMETMIGVHGLGRVHADLRPEKIVVTGRGQAMAARLWDFGVAELVQGLSVEGRWPGVPPYLAPEQRRSRDAGVQTDIFALGMILWRLITGRLPVDPSDAIALRNFYNGTHPIPRLRDLSPQIPAVVSDAVERATAHDAGQRHTSVRSFWMHLVGVEVPKLASPLPQRRPQMTPVQAISSVPPSSSSLGSGGTSGRLGVSGLPPRQLSGSRPAVRAKKDLSQLPPRWSSATTDDAEADGVVVTPASSGSGERRGLGLPSMGMKGIGAELDATPVPLDSGEISRPDMAVHGLDDSLGVDAADNFDSLLAESTPAEHETTPTSGARPLAPMTAGQDPFASDPPAAQADGDFDMLGESGLGDEPEALFLDGDDEPVVERSRPKVSPTTVSRSAPTTDPFADAMFLEDAPADATETRPTSEPSPDPFADPMFAEEDAEAPDDDYGGLFASDGAGDLFGDDSGLFGDDALFAPETDEAPSVEAAPTPAVTDATPGPASTRPAAAPRKVFGAVHDAPTPMPAKPDEPTTKPAPVIAPAPPKTPTLDDEEERCYEKNDWQGLLEVLDKKFERAKDADMQVRLLLQKGEVYALRFNDAKLAAATYRRALEVRPGHVVAAKRLAKELRRLREWPELSHLLRQIADAQDDPEEQVETLHRLGNLLSRKLPDPERAVDVYERIREIAPHDSVALDGLETLYEQTGRWRDLLGVLDARVADADELNDKIAIVFQKGTICADHLNDREAAEQAFNEVLTLFPRHMPALNALESIYRETKQDAKLGGVLSKQAEATQIPELRAGIWAEVAILAERSGDALLAYDAAVGRLEMQPDDAELLDRVASDGPRLGRHAVALKAALKRLERGAVTSAAACLLAFAKHPNLGELELAGEVAKALATRQPQEPAIQAFATVVALEHEEWDKAQAHLDQFMASGAAGTDALARTWQMRLARGRCEWDVALEHALAARRLDEDAIDATTVAELLIYGGRASDAITLLRARLEEAPEQTINRVLLAEAYAVARRVDDARDVWTAFDDAWPEVFEARVAVLADRPRKALNLAHIVLEDEDELGPRQRVVARWAAAAALNALGDTVQAGKMLDPVEDVVHIFPPAAELWERLRGDASIAALERSAEETSDPRRRASVFDKLSARYADEGDLEGAVRALRSAIGVRPTQGRQLQLVELLTQTKDWEGVVTVLVDVAEGLSSPAKQARILLAAAQTAADEVQDFDRAIALGARAHTLRPKDEVRHLVRVWLELEDRLDEAEALGLG